MIRKAPETAMIAARVCIDMASLLGSHIFTYTVQGRTNAFVSTYVCCIYCVYGVQVGALRVVYVSPDETDYKSPKVGHILQRQTNKIKRRVHYFFHQGKSIRILINGYRVGILHAKCRISISWWNRIKQACMAWWVESIGELRDKKKKIMT